MSIILSYHQPTRGQVISARFNINIACITKNIWFTTVSQASLNIKEINLKSDKIEITYNLLTEYYKTLKVGEIVQLVPLEKELPNLEFIVKRKRCLTLFATHYNCLLYTSPSPRDKRQCRMPSSA